MAEGSDSIDEWRGRVNATLEQHHARLNGHSREIERVEERQTTIEIKQGKMTVQIGIAAAVGGVIGTIVSAVIAGLVLRGVGG